MKNEPNIDTTTIAEQCTDAPAKTAPKKSSKKAGAPKAKKKREGQEGAGARQVRAQSERPHKQEVRSVAMMKRAKGITAPGNHGDDGLEAHTVRRFVSISSKGSEN